MTKTLGLDWEATLARLRRAEHAINSANSHSEEELRNIFDRRAAALASRSVETAELADKQVLFVRTGEARYGIPLRYVVEVVDVPRITPAPGTPAGILGLVQIRGEIRVVWSLRHFLGITATDAAVRNMLVVRHGSIEIGLAVDETEDIRLVDEAQLGRVADARHTLGITKDLTPVLNMETLLATTTVGNH